LDVARNGNAWKETLKANIWSNNWMAGDMYQNWLVQEEAKIKTLYTELGL
jgi:tripartite-type tricarboxylate transporter receptor subunit TctC